MGLTTAYGSLPTTTELGKWVDYAANWSSEPVLQTTISEGDVYLYTYANGTAYRLVPTDGVSEDAFYSTFTNNTLSDLIVSRGMTI